MRFRKLVGAFADGELEVHDNLDILEHLNMCPGCAARVAEVEGLKNSLRRCFSGVKAPARLHARVQELCGETVAARAAGSRFDPRRLARRWSHWAVPLGMAAALGLVVTLRSQILSGPPEAGTITVVTGRVVADVRGQHAACVHGRGLRHHEAGLPRRVPDLGRILGRDLHLAVLAPDLSARGFNLVGADRCGIRGRRGAHVLYASAATGTMLSVFTVDRLAGLGPVAGSSKEKGGYFISDEGTSVVAWDDGPQTYVLCGDFPTAELTSLANAVRNTAVSTAASAGAMLATVVGG
ncbi:MAG: anti-sigma factor family protein [Phycisphaerae bacterium]